MKNISLKNKILRDGACPSPWEEETDLTMDPDISSSDVLFDCVIVGGGITGLTAALLIQTSGKRTMIAEAHNLGFGTTGGTSAHINTFADTSFNEVEKAFGEQGAQLFAEAIRDGLELISTNSTRYKIDCDLEVKPGFIYAETKEEVEELDAIFHGADKVGVAVKYVESVPTPVPFVKALQFEGQAQFHPLKYLLGLRDAYLKAGGTMSENTLIESVSTKDNVHTVQAGDRSIKAKTVIYATHMPPNLSVFNFECAAYRSYVMAVKLKSDDYPDALIYDSQEPYHYVRTHIIDGEQQLLVGGLDHKTGHEDAEKAFAGLEKYIRNYYNVSSIQYKWSSQYYIPVDGLPYIGKLPLSANGIYCATGYNGNGMMLGSIAGKLLSELVNGSGSKYEKLFDPSRIKLVDGFKEFLKENADVAYHFVADRFGFHESDSINRLVKGTGKLIEVDGKKIAAYRDEDGKVYALSPVCTHAACIVGWNSQEKSWDCPCHGARYDIHGNVLTGPATKGLPPVEITD